MRRQGVRKNHGLWKKEDADSAMPLDVFVQGVGGATPTPERPKSHEINLKGINDPDFTKANAPKRKADAVLSHDPMGLDFQADRKLKIGQVERDEPQHDARFPLLKEFSTLSQGAKFKKGITKNAENVHLGKEEVAGEQLDTKVPVSRGAEKKQDNNLPKMNTDRFSGYQQRYQSSKDKLQTMGPATGIQSHGKIELPAVNPPLVPFGMSETSSQRDKNSDRKVGLSFPPSKSDSKVARRVSKQTEKENRGSLTDVKQVTFSRSSVSPTSPPRLSSSQRLLQDEAYCLENLRFTTNFTFSFFEAPPAYKTQTNMLRASVNTLGEKGKPKFSQKPPKSPKKPKQEKQERQESVKESKLDL